MNRRSFLKVLSATPAIAALPAFPAPAVAAADYPFRSYGLGVCAHVDDELATTLARNIRGTENLIAANIVEQLRPGLEKIFGDAYVDVPEDMFA